jgi:hypothetical protein
MTDVKTRAIQIPTTIRMKAGQFLIIKRNANGCGLSVPAYIRAILAEYTPEATLTQPETPRSIRAKDPDAPHLPHVRVTPETHQHLTCAARKHGFTLKDYIRALVWDACLERWAPPLDQVEPQHRAPDLEPVCTFEQATAQGTPKPRAMQIPGGIYMRAGQFLELKRNARDHDLSIPAYIRAILAEYTPTVPLTQPETAANVLTKDPDAPCLPRVRVPIETNRRLTCAARKHGFTLKDYIGALVWDACLERWAPPLDQVEPQDCAAGPAVDQVEPQDRHRAPDIDPACAFEQAAAQALDDIHQHLMSVHEALNRAHACWTRWRILLAHASAKSPI